MRKIMKNLLLIIVMAIMCFAMSMTASAETITGECGAEGDNVTWTLDTEAGSLVINGTGAMKDYGYGSSPFYENLTIKSVVIETGVTSIGNSAFFGCTSLANIEIPDSVITIGNSAFDGCTSLASIEIPDSVTSIGYNAFMGCSGITELVIPDSVTSIGFGSFFTCTSLESLTVDENNLYYSSDEYGILFNKDKTELIYCPYNIEADSYVIPSGVEKIEQVAFYMTGLKEITIPEGVKEIGYLAFADSNIEKINLPSSLEKIGEMAFVSCLLLNDVVLPENLAVIESGAFSACESLTDITVLSKNVEGYEISGLGYSEMYHDKAFYETLDFIRETGNGVWMGENSEEFEELLSKIVFYDTPQPLGIFHRHDDSESYSVDSYAEENGFELVRTHFYDEWSTTVEPTCSKAGEEIRHCTYCDYFETNELETKDHTFGDWTYDWDNCIRTRKCELCEATETEILETNTEGDAEIIAPSNPDADFDIESIINGDERYVLVENSMNTYHGGHWKIVKIFDITLKNKDGVHVQPDGTVKVKLPHDWIHNNYKVYRVNDDGTITDMKAYQEGSHVVFETDHFSLYVIVDESTPEEPDTPDEPSDDTFENFFDKLIAWFKEIINSIRAFFRSIGDHS